MNIIGAELLKYSLDDINWLYKHLTQPEKDIVGNQANLNELRELCEKELELKKEDENKKIKSSTFWDKYEYVHVGYVDGFPIYALREKP